MSFPRLFSPITINGVEIKNRIVFLPHYTCYSTQDHMPSKRDQYYYRERARGGAGLVVVPVDGVSRDRHLHKLDIRI